MSTQEQGQNSNLETHADVLSPFYHIDQEKFRPIDVRLEYSDYDRISGPDPRLVDVEIHDATLIHDVLGKERNEATKRAAFQAVIDDTDTQNATMYIHNIWISNDKHPREYALATAFLHPIYSNKYNITSISSFDIPLPEPNSGFTPEDHPISKFLREPDVESYLSQAGFSIRPPEIHENADGSRTFTVGAAKGDK